MNELRVFNFNDAEVVDSRDVAEMTNVRHADLIEKITGYMKHLANGNFRSLDFFIPNTYKDAQDKPRPCYLLTKKGCDMVANKMTGEKGVLFTAAYVSAFEKMREHIQGGKTKRLGMTDYQMESIRVRKAQLLERLAKEYDGTYRQVLQAHATKELTGEYLLPLPYIGEKTYSAQEIGEKLGISANKVGMLANRNHLKTKQYGTWVNDVAKNCPGKEVPSFRYYESVVPVLKTIISKQ
jgi:Rha family phage regulatory protein|nr:MAG TPA: regulatory protein [Caudoviricetes sp.]